MKVVIRDLEAFEAAVFGAECFVKQYPELQTTGITIKRLFKADPWYYIIDPATEWYYDISAFFTKEDLKYLKQVRIKK